MNICSYCGINAFLGSVNILISESSVSEFIETKTGSRPTNSGIIPKFIKSCASVCANNLSFSWRASFVSLSVIVFRLSGPLSLSLGFDGPKPKIWRVKMKVCMTLSEPLQQWTTKKKSIYFNFSLIWMVLWQLAQSI